MSRISFRSRPVDIDRQLPIVRDPTQLDGGDGVSRNVAHGHQDLDRENEKVRHDMPRAAGGETQERVLPEKVATIALQGPAKKYFYMPTNPLSKDLICREFAVVLEDSWPSFSMCTPQSYSVEAPLCILPLESASFPRMPVAD